MADMTFDETYNVREAMDFLIEKLALREKLIQSARQISEKDGGQKFGVTVKRFEDLLADFLKLYQPVFDKIAGHKEALQKDIFAQRQALTGVLGMIEVARGVEVLADRVRELEAEAKGIDAVVKERSKTIERIDDLLGRAKHRSSDVSRPTFEPSMADISQQPDDFLSPSSFLPSLLNDSGRKQTVPKKHVGRN